MTLLHGIVDYYSKNTEESFMSNAPYFLVVLIEEIFLRTPFPVSGNLYFLLQLFDFVSI